MNTWREGRESQRQKSNVLYIMVNKGDALGGLVRACLRLDPRLAGSNPAEEDVFLRTIKSIANFRRRGSKPFGPMS
jgi:hypothetical protein